MSDDNRTGGWASLIKSVRTPLGFFTLVALVLDAFMIGITAFTSILQIWIPLALLGLLVIAVFFITKENVLALYHPDDWPQRKKVYVLFKDKTMPPDLNISKCKLIKRDTAGHEKPKMIPNLRLDNGGWSFLLPPDVVETDSVRLILFDTNDVSWTVAPFPPFESTVDAKQIS